MAVNINIGGDIGRTIADIFNTVIENSTDPKINMEIDKTNKKIVLTVEFFRDEEIGKIADTIERDVELILQKK